MAGPPAETPPPTPSVHKPVLLREVLELLDLRPGLTVVDGTVGGGGHSRHILEHIGPAGMLVGLDRDQSMLARAAVVLSAPNCRLRQASYAELPQVLEDLGIGQVDRVLLDLGLSSDQLADAARGFGFQAAGPLDMRFDESQGTPAWQLLEQLDAAALEEIFHRYGEERFAGRIAARIVERRRLEPVRTAPDLAAVVEAAVPAKFRREARKHPATRIFQALRIAVNRELEHLETAVGATLPGCLAPGGRLVVITFHSLEDRIVKHAFRDKHRWQEQTSKPVIPRATEQRINPRARSAKLRAAVRR
ncbi:MAG TPA: 16S rRNA (cytosine(1402)-N(4))-methyltransferase RsmH [Planctomycetaceae bacterium]|nr:16S rRNA (cytosine(1402)-N(4))-methyltransferase RsmH [Planctomycetaceae bacterium]